MSGLETMTLNLAQRVMDGGANGPYLISSAAAATHALSDV